MVGVEEQHAPIRSAYDPSSRRNPDEPREAALHRPTQEVANARRNQSADQGRVAPCSASKSACRGAVPLTTRTQRVRTG